MEPKWRQDGVKTAKKSEKNINATKIKLPSISLAVLDAKKWPTWLQLGCQDGAKMV